MPLRPARFRPSRRVVFSTLSAAALSAFAASGFAADPPAADAVFKFQPAQKGVDIETPPKAEWEKCQVKVERQGKQSGWVVLGPQGQVVRRFLDTDGDNVVDQWRYFKNGLEVYRDLDSNKNNKVDQSRWLNSGGTRWGLDTDEDGRIDRWKVLSAEEASRVAVEAMLRGDAAELKSVLVSADDLKASGVNADLMKQLLEAVADPSAKMRDTASGSKILGSKTTWMRFDSSSPGVVPADDGKADRDLFVYENAMGIVDVAGQPGLIQIGEMLRVGDVWKLTQIPQPIEGEQVQITAGGLLMQPQMVAPDAVPGGIPPAMRKLLEDLQKLDAASPQPSAGTEAFARYNAERAKILAGLVEASTTAEDKDQWTRQLADSVSAAVQTGVYPDGLATLGKLEADLAKANAEKGLLAYVTYRRLVADYSQRLASADSETRLDVQKWWLAQLKDYADRYPETPDAAEALLQLAVSEEFAGNVDEATAWYEQLAKAHPKTDPGMRAAGAVYRLGLKGKPFAFESVDLKGGRVRADDYRGKVLLVLFWTTNNQYAEQDLPVLRALYQKHQKDGFEILGVNLDQNAADVGPYVQKNAIPWRQSYEAGGFESKPARQFGIVALPTMILVGRDGKVVSRAVATEDLKQSLPDLLKAGG